MIYQNDRQARVVAKFSFVIFCASVIAASVWYGIWWWLGIFGSFPVALLAGISFWREYRRFFVPWGLWTAMFVLALMVSNEFRDIEALRFERIIKNAQTINELSGIVTATRPSWFDMKAVSLNGTPLGFKISIRAYVPLDRASEGKHVRVFSGKRVVSTYSPYPAFRFDRAEIVNAPGPFPKLRDRLANVSNRLYPRREAGLIRGILFWDGSGIAEEDSESYRKSGLSHLVVASGGNVAVFSGILAIFAKRMPNLVRLGILLWGIWGYCALAGSGIPIIRAAIMASVATLAEPYFKCDVVPVLFWTWAVMTILDPSMGSSASFLLSFSATLWMATLAHEAAETFTLVTKRFSIRETLSATFAATLATIPVSASFFGTLATVSILSNILVVPFLAFAAIPTLLGMVFEVGGFSFAATMFAAVGYGTLKWTNAVSDWMGGLAFSSIILNPVEAGILGVAGAVFFMILSIRKISNSP